MPDIIKFAFVCSPFRNNPEENRKLTTDVCRIITAKTSYIPLAPHLYFPTFMKEKNTTERSLGISAGFKWLDSCDVMIVIMKNNQITEGMMDEINYAKKLEKPIIAFKNYDDFFKLSSSEKCIFETLINNTIKLFKHNPCEGCVNNYPHLLACNGMCNRRNEKTLFVEFSIKEKEY
jgi:nucleoside 2-deoxyribosyltransferase